MSRRDRYPDISYGRLSPKTRAGCSSVGCNERARYRVEIQQTHMRGDDDVFKLCPACRAAARNGSPSKFKHCERVYIMVGKHQSQERI